MYVKAKRYNFYVNEHYYCLQEAHMQGKVSVHVSSQWHALTLEFKVSRLKKDSCLPVEEHLHFWADVGPSRVDLDAECHDGQNSRHSEKLLTDVEGHVGRGEGDGDLH